MKSSDNYVIKTRYLIKSYVYWPRFPFMLDSLPFPSNIGHYKPKPLCFSKKWPGFDSKILIWVHSREHRTVHLLCVSGGCYDCTKLVAKNYWEGWIQMGKVAQVCMNLSWRNEFIVPSPMPKPTPSPATGYTRNLGPKLCGASGGTTSRPRL